MNNRSARKIARRAAPSSLNIHLFLSAALDFLIGLTSIDPATEG